MPVQIMQQKTASSFFASRQRAVRMLASLARVTGKWGVLLCTCLGLLLGPQAQAQQRLKDLASIAGVRQNQLLGYGLVVGLDGSGDQTTQTPFTVQSVLAMLQQLGVNMPAGTSLQLKNVAAVMVTANLPAFAQPGQTVDITVSSMGNAKSLRGGTLMMTPLKGADNQIYAMAQGSVLVSSAGAAAAGGKAPVNHLSVGRITDGATVERAVPSSLGQGNMIALELNTTDFTTASRVVEKINEHFGPDVAAAQDGRVIKVHAPSSADQRVAFIGTLQNLVISPGTVAAKVVLNARTGSVVLNQAVILDQCAISHGNLSITVLPEGAAAAAAAAEPKKEAGSVLMLKAGASLAEVVKALNAVGATPQDLLAILQAMKAAGSLHAELEVI